MKFQIEVKAKFTTLTQLQSIFEDIVRTIAVQSPNDIRELEDKNGVHGYWYDLGKNDSTDIYGNELSDDKT